MKIFLILLFFYVHSSGFAQKPEWMIVDVQELIMYEAIRDIFDFDLTNQEILEILNGDYGTLWFTTQDYKIKYLPNNLVIYSKLDLDIPLYFFSQSNLSLRYYSRIDKKEIADKLPANTWVKYDDPDNYEYVMWANEKKIVDESQFEFYKLDNYSIPLSEEKEITGEELLTSVLFNYPALQFSLDGNNENDLISRSDINISEQLSYKNLLKASAKCETIFDILNDAEGNVWLATGKRLIRFDGKRFFQINIPAIALENDLQNNLWIGTSAYNSVGSVIKFDGLNFTYYNSLNSPVPDNDGIFDIETDYQGNLWIAMKRTGLPGNPDNIKLAVYNPSGVKILTESLLYSIHWIRKPFSENLKSIFTDQFYVTMNPETFKLYTMIELLLNNKVISTIDTKNEFSNNESFELTFFVDKPDKYSFTVYAYDFNYNKIEIGNYELNDQFNANGYFLDQNKPNPFSNFTRIEYGFFQGSMLALKIFNSFINQVDIHKERYVEWMGRPFLFNSEKLPNGVYSYYLQENYSGIVDAKKMILFDPEKIITLPQKADKP